MKNILSILFTLIVLNLFAQIPPGYYDGTEGLSGDVLKSALNDIIDGHTELSYTGVWDALRDTDEDPENTDNVILLYTGWSVSNSGYPIWNREHTWAKSHGDFGNDPPCGTDIHHIRPTDVQVNSDRGNLDFDYSDNPYPTIPGCFYDDDSWEPRDEVKGDVARMIFYMATRYEGENGELDLVVVDEVNTYPNPEHGKLSALLEWNELDPPSVFEETRNDRIYDNWQGNRNPFIDHPEFVDLIWNPVSADENQISLSSFNLHNYPNPFNPTTIISFSLTTENTELSIYNIRGQKIRVFTFPNQSSHKATTWQAGLGTSEYSVVWNGTDSNNKSVASGIYFYQLRVNNIPVQTRKCVLIK
jgi:endonuclease I